MAEGFGSAPGQFLRSVRRSCREIQINQTKGVFDSRANRRGGGEGSSAKALRSAVDLKELA